MCLQINACLNTLLERNTGTESWGSSDSRNNQGVQIVTCHLKIFPVVAHHYPSGKGGMALGGQLARAESCFTFLPSFSILQMET